MNSSEQAFTFEAPGLGNCDRRAERNNRVVLSAVTQDLLLRADWLHRKTSKPPAEVCTAVIVPARTSKFSECVRWAQYYWLKRLEYFIHIRGSFLAADRHVAFKTSEPPPEVRTAVVISAI